MERVRRKGLAAFGKWRMTALEDQEGFRGVDGEGELAEEQKLVQAAFELGATLQAVFARLVPKSFAVPRQAVPCLCAAIACGGFGKATFGWKGRCWGKAEQPRTARTCITAALQPCISLVLWVKGCDGEDEGNCDVGEGDGIGVEGDGGWAI